MRRLPAALSTSATPPGEIHHWHQTGQRRVMWYKASRLFASTPETATETADAERMILDAFARWEGKP